jgi:hypothetical protein
MCSRPLAIALLLSTLIAYAQAEVYELDINPGELSATIAAGDSISFTSNITGVVFPYLNCGSHGIPFPIFSGLKATLPFGNPGNYLAVIKQRGIEIASVRVNVVKALMTPRADQVGFARAADFQVLPNASLVTFRSNDTSRLDVTQTGTDGDLAHLNLRAKARGDLRVQAVIQSPAGPRVIGEAEVQEFTIDTPALFETIVDADSGIGTTRLTMHPFVPNVIVTFTMFAHRSTFSGGAKRFTVMSDAFAREYNPSTGESDGTYLFDIEVPTDEDRYCLKIDFSQANSDPVPIGSSGNINGHPCKVTVDLIVMCAASGGKNLVVTVVQDANPNGHQHPIMIVGSTGTPQEAVFQENRRTTSDSKIDCNVQGHVLSLRVLPGRTGKFYDVQIEQTIFSKRITVVDIAFSKTEIRPGIPQRWHANVQATVTPAGYTAYFTSSNPRATVAPASGSGTVSLAVGGVMLSGANKDTRLEARLDSPTGEICHVISVTVVEPRDYQSTPTATDTTPALAAGSMTAVEWRNDISITIKDQFGVTLQDNWDGLVVEENVNAVGWGALPPTSGGIVIDPVRAVRDYAAAPAPGGVVWAAEIVAGTRPAGGTVVPTPLPQQLRAVVEAGAPIVIGPTNNRVNTLNGPASSFTTTNSH